MLLQYKFTLYNGTRQTYSYKFTLYNGTRQTYKFRKSAASIFGQARVTASHSRAMAAAAALMSCEQTPTTGKYTLAAQTRKFEAKRAHNEQLDLAVALVAAAR